MFQNTNQNHETQTKFPKHIRPSVRFLRGCQATARVCQPCFVCLAAIYWNLTTISAQNAEQKVLPRPKHSNQQIVKVPTGSKITTPVTFKEFRVRKEKANSNSNSYVCNQRVNFYPGPRQTRKSHFLNLYKDNYRSCKRCSPAHSHLTEYAKYSASLLVLEFYLL